MYICKTNILLHQSAYASYTIEYPNHRTTIIRLSQHPGVVFFPKLDHLVHLHPNTRHNKY